VNRLGRPEEAQALLAEAREIAETLPPGHRTRDLVAGGLP
jgi:hypothetical protein